MQAQQTGRRPNAGRYSTGIAVSAIVGLGWALVPWVGAGLHVTFDQNAEGEGGVAPVVVEQVAYVESLTGKAVVLDRPSKLAYPAKSLDRNAFTVTLRVRHDQDMKSLIYPRLTYLHHETDDLKNRLGLVKRAGSRCLVFFMSNGTGRAKGDDFAGDWFAMTAGPIDWKAGTWHEITVTASRADRKAQLIVDGRKVAEATGDQMPDRLDDRLWVGSQAGHSWMRGQIDDLTVLDRASLVPGPVQPYPEPLYPPLPPVRRLESGSVKAVTGKTMSLNLDFFDVCIGLDTWDMRYCEREMERLMALTAHYGFDRLFYRVSVCGAVAYHTQTMTPADEKAFEKYRGRRILDTCCANIPSSHMRMADVMARIDPLREAVTYGHKHGLDIYAWVTSWDSMYYATEDEFFRRNPRFTWVSRDGKRHIPGVPCYAYPEVREYRLAQIGELLDYDVDGIMLSPRSHSPWPGRRKASSEVGSRDYGYNEPVIAEYTRRYGTDPREAERDSLEQLRFVQLKAEFFNQFLKDAKRLCDHAGKTLMLVTSDGGSDPIRAGRMYIDAETILRERLVHELCLMGSPAADLARWRVLGGDDVTITTWASIHGTGYDECMPRMRSQLAAMFDNPLSQGSTFHELANLVYPDCWEEAVIDVVKEKAAARAGQTE